MSSSLRTLPSGALLLHVGPYKTGSSAIQQALASRRQELRAHGVLYPGSETRARLASWDILGQTRRGFEQRTAGQWQDLVDEVRAAPDLRVCVSTESFGRAEPEKIERIVEDLGPDRVYVVAVARRLDRLLPSAWQQRVQYYATHSYDEFLHAVLDEPSDDPNLAAMFWRSQNIEQLLRRWSDVLGEERMILIVADDSDRELLRRTFEQLLDLPEGMLAHSPRSNPSLSLNGAELVRRLNEVFEEEGWPDHLYHQVVEHGAIPTMKNAPRSPEDLPIPSLPSWAASRVAELSAERVERLRATGVHVVGALDNLLVPTQSDGTASIEPPTTISIDTAVRALQGAAAGALRLEAKCRREAKSRETARRPRNDERPPRPGGRLVRRTSSSELLRVVWRRQLARLRRLGRRSAS